MDIAPFVADFGAAEAGLAAGAIGYDVVAFFEEVLVPGAFEIGPFAFDVLVFVGPVSFILIYGNA